MLLRIILAIALLWSLPASAIIVPKETPPATDEEDTAPAPNTVILQGLNKVTGHISKLEIPIGTSTRFGNLEIIARRCWKSSPDEQPENAALLEMSESKPGEAPQKIFLGWMFSSSPGLSGLEHPVYDITVLSCETRDNPEGSDKPEKPAGKPEKPEKPEKK
jgi:hypothetical protein